ncbi:MAG: NfeD family protein [Ornithinimicrobium sp.]
MEWLRETQWLWWTAAALILGLIEIASLDLVFTMLAGSALVAAVAAFLGVPFPVQVIVFVITAVLLLALLRPLLLRRLNLTGPPPTTNADANVGQRAEVLSAVTDRSGTVKLRGEEWTARAAEPDQELTPGQMVNVIRIDGATAVVSAEAPDNT